MATAGSGANGRLQVETAAGHAGVAGRIGPRRSRTLGFQRGGALTTAGVATLFTDAAPIAAGMWLFGDGLPSGALGVARVLSFVAVVAGAALITRSSGSAIEVVPAGPVSAP